MSNNDTFVNMDEVRGWGVRALRENKSHEITRRKTKNFLKMLGGTGLYLVGLHFILDGIEKYGIWEGVERVISKDMEDAFVKDAHSMGYKIDGE